MLLLTDCLTCCWVLARRMAQRALEASRSSSSTSPPRWTLKRCPSAGAELTLALGMGKHEAKGAEVLTLRRMLRQGHRGWGLVRGALVLLITLRLLGTIRQACAGPRPNALRFGG
jgi:hypothetical protein